MESKEEQERINKLWVDFINSAPKEFKECMIILPRNSVKEKEK